MVRPVRTRPSAATDIPDEPEQAHVQELSASHDTPPTFMFTVLVMVNVPEERYTVSPTATEAAALFGVAKACAQERPEFESVPLVDTNHEVATAPWTASKIRTSWKQSGVMVAKCSTGDAASNLQTSERSKSKLGPGEQQRLAQRHAPPMNFVRTASQPRTLGEGSAAKPAARWRRQRGWAEIFRRTVTPQLFPFSPFFPSRLRR